MHHFSITILLILFLITGINFPAFSAVKGGINYTIPVDYSNLSEEEVEKKANEYFYLAEKLQDNIINNDMTNALMHYSILEKINPKKIEYTVKLGILYDKIKKDRRAKGCFAKAISINSQSPLPYFYYGEFYYKRESYRKALKYYNEAYKHGFKNNYDLLYKMGDVYEKLGDTRSALKYLNEARNQNPNEKIEEKIKHVELQDAVNKEFYSDTRIHN